jgi:hypothetical protein
MFKSRNLMAATKKSKRQIVNIKFKPLLVYSYIECDQFGPCLIENPHYLLANVRLPQ